jgi:hypothetical protein
MTREQRYAIIKMVKDYVKLGADINALKSLLASEQIARRVLPNWEADFRALQNSPRISARSRSKRKMRLPDLSKQYLMTI